MDAKEVAKTIREWATEMVGYPNRFGPFPDCFTLVAIKSLASMKSLAETTVLKLISVIS